MSGITCGESRAIGISNKDPCLQRGVVIKELTKGLTARFDDSLAILRCPTLKLILYFCERSSEEGVHSHEASPFSFRQAELKLFLPRHTCIL